MSAGSVDVLRISIQSTFHIVSHAKHSGSTDLQGSALLEKKFGDVHVANLSRSLYGRLCIVLVPSIRCIQEFRILSKHLSHLLVIPVSRYDEFSDLFYGRRLLLGLHKLLIIEAEVYSFLGN